MESERRPLLESISEPSIGDTRNNEDRGLQRYILVEPILVLFLLSSCSSSQIIHQRLVTYINQTYHNHTSIDNSTIGQLGSDNSNRHQEVTLLNGVTLLLTVVPALFLLIYLGPCSDYAGRKKLLFPPLLGALLANCLAVFIIEWELPVVFLPLCLLIFSLSGGNACLLVGCFAYVADSSSHAQRLFRFVILEVCVSLAVVLTDTTLDYILYLLGNTNTLAAIICIVVGLLLYTRCLLPETNQRTSVPPSTCQNMCYSFWLFVKDDGSRRKAKLQLSLVVIFLLMVMLLGTSSVIASYLSHTPISWDETFMRYFSGAMFIFPALAALLLAGTLTSKLAETTFILGGCISITLFFVFLSASTSTTVIFLGTVANAGMLLPMGALRALTSKLVSGHEHGALFTGISVVTSLASIVGPVFFNTLYGQSTRHWMSLTWVVAAALMALLILLTALLRWLIWSEKKDLLESLYISPESTSSTLEIGNSSRYQTSNPASTETSINDFSSSQPSDA